jgi:hypothetical protein
MEQTSEGDNAMTPEQKQQDMRRRLNDIAHTVDERLPEGHGFIVLAFPFGQSTENRLQYVSNANREDALKVMKEWMIKCGAHEDWMKDLK